MAKYAKILLCFLFLIFAKSTLFAQWGKSDLYYFDIKDEIIITDEFISGNVGDAQIGSLGWRRYAANGGNLQAWSIPSKDVFGSINLATSTTLNGAAAIYFNLNQLGNSSKGLTLSFRANTSVASNLGWIIGFSDNIGVGPTITDGVYFYLNTATDNNWRAISVSNGISTTIDTGVPIDVSFHWFTIKLNEEQADFYIDGVHRAKITNNIPTGDSRLFSVVNNVWSLDTIEKIVWVDVFQLKIKVDR